MNNLPGDMIIRTMPVVAIPKHGGGYRGAWSIGWEYCTHEVQKGDRWEWHMTHFKHPQVSGTVTVLVDRKCAVVHQQVVDVEFAPELLGQCFVVIASWMDVRYTSARKRELVELEKKHSFSAKDYDRRSGKHYYAPIAGPKKSEVSPALKALLGRHAVYSTNVGSIGHVDHSEYPLYAAIKGAVNR